ncbi:hypothetical protein BG004_001543 [Podila humilis]|nr:hypothetical protein BG004_001543 [Podila humilis]
MVCKSWPLEEDNFEEIDAKLIEHTGNPATARFVNDIFERVEVTLTGGDKMYGYFQLDNCKRLGEGATAYLRPMKRRSTEVITDSKLQLALKSHTYGSLVNPENYRALRDNDPLCTVRFSDKGKALARSMARLLIQSGNEILLCLKVEVYGRRESEDCHNIPKLGEPDGHRSFKVTNQRHDKTNMIIIGTVRWNALVTMSVQVTSGRVVVGPNNPWFHPHAASHVWLLKDGDEDFHNNVERHTRSKFDQQSSYELYAAVHPRFLGHRTMPVTLSTLWEFKAKGKAKTWSGIKLAAFVFHQLLHNGKITKSEVALQMDELRMRENSLTEVAADGIVANLSRLLEAMSDEETKPVSLEVSNELRQLAEKLQGEITNINNTTIADEVKMLIGSLVES